MFDKIKFGNAIKNLCKINSITAYQLAQELNVSEDYLYKIQNGKNIPSIALFVSIINYFGVTSSDYSNFNITSNINDILQEETVFLSNEEYKFLYDSILDHIYDKKGTDINV